jgi:hypothetical protein
MTQLSDQERMLIPSVFFFFPPFGTYSKVSADPVQTGRCHKVPVQAPVDFDLVVRWSFAIKQILCGF